LITPFDGQSPTAPEPNQLNYDMEYLCYSPKRITTGYYSKHFPIVP